MKCIVFFVSLLPTVLLAQQYPRDTSYTVHEAFLKSVKEFPFIAEVLPDTLADIDVNRNIPYKTVADRNLYLDTFSPGFDSNILKPAVVMIHGGGWISGNKSHMAPMAIQLASNGYVAVAVEYRLSPEAIFPAGVHDIKAAIKWVKEHSGRLLVDTAKVAILGCSSGGQLASLVGMSNRIEKLEGTTIKSTCTSDIHAIINMDGVLAFHHPDSKEGRVAGLWLGGSYQEAGVQWDEASALTYASEDDPPTLFIHSQYPRFHAGREDVIQIMNKHGIYTEVQSISNSPHTFWLFSPWFDTTLNYTLNFLDRVFHKI